MRSPHWMPRRSGAVEAAFVACRPARNVSLVTSAGGRSNETLIARWRSPPEMFLIFRLTMLPGGDARAPPRGERMLPPPGRAVSAGGMRRSFGAVDGGGDSPDGAKFLNRQQVA